MTTKEFVIDNNKYVATIIAFDTETTIVLFDRRALKLLNAYNALGFTVYSPPEYDYNVFYPVRFNNLNSITDSIMQGIWNQLK